MHLQDWTTLSTHSRLTESPPPPDKKRAARVGGHAHQQLCCIAHNSGIYSLVSRLLILFIKMAYLLPHLHSGWEVDQAILTEEDRVVVIRFGRDQDATCMVQDEVLMSIADKVKNFAVIYLVDIDEVPDYNNMYELFDDCTTMFFYRNKVRMYCTFIEPFQYYFTSHPLLFILHSIRPKAHYGRSWDG